jgi:hypothetical protein
MLYKHIDTMKKILLLFTIILLVGGKLFAQEFNIGVMGGLNMATVTEYTVNGQDDDANTVENPDFRTGFHLGLFGEFGLVDILQIKPAILYSQKGFKSVNTYNTIFGSNTVTTTTKLDYIDIPVLLKLKPVPMVSFQAGPVFSFLANREVEREYEDGSSEAQEQDPFDENDLSNSDILAYVGVGFEASQVRVDVGYNFGFAKVDKEDSDNRARNEVFQVSLGFAF